MRGDHRGRRFLLLLLCSAFLYGCAQKEQEDLQEAVLEENTEDTEDTEDRAGDGQEKEEAEQEKIVVYVCGHVQAPGVYTLDMGSRICDALAAAGGMSETAAQTYLNQAQLLTDGEKVYVPSAEEAESPVLSADASAQGKAAQDGKVSLNTADRETLMTLSGIGEAKADAIIAYREENGGFSSLEELMQVDGIKEGTFEKIKEDISL